MAIVPVTTAATPAGAANTSTDALVQIHPLPDKENNGLILRIDPPKLPQETRLSHVPCSIALLIDVSASMQNAAPVPGETAEKTRLSILDLAKHACRTITSTLDENDEMALVTFSDKSTVVQPLIPMTPENKEQTEIRIEEMYPQATTNLWQALKDGVKLFENKSNTGRVPAVMVLTDGVPNHMCPGQGYIPALRGLGSIVPSIHTFGFGDALRSGLLKSIAELGRGNYSFIPDAGMIGTVFVQAVANLQSTFAIDASVKLVYAEHMEIQETAGPFVGQEQPVHRDDGQHQLTIPLGNIQYGQSRDIYLRWNSKSADGKLAPRVSATLHYSHMTETQHTSTTDCSLLNTSLALSAADIAYHISRHHICAFLADLFPLDALDEHRMAIRPGSDSEPTAEQAQARLKQLVASLPAARHPDDARCASLLQDLAGAEPHGQVGLALSRADYLKRWGQHYLPSLHGAHARQLCNSFKDPGPLQYGTGSPLLARCRDRLNAAFDGLPAPTPSIELPSLPGYMSTQHGIADGGDRLRSEGMRLAGLTSMQKYNQSDNPCFAARTPVRLAGGRGRAVPIAALERGMRVETPRGPRAVAAVLVTPVRKATMIRWRGVLVTPWHPVAGAAAGGRDQEGLQGSAEREWAFPCRLGEEDDGEDKAVVLYTGCIYSILLQRDQDVDAHAVMLGGGTRGGRGGPFWGVTLGHGMLSGSDARAHGFFGSYDAVVGSLSGLRVVKGGKFCSGGVKRSSKTGLVCGFKNGRLRVGAHALALSLCH